MSLIRSHILVCTGTGCSSSQSPKIIAEFEKQLAAQGMDREAKVVRTGCFGLCALGPIVTIYPEGACYTHVTVDDVEEIVAEHIVKGRIVKRLLNKNEGGDGPATSLAETRFYKHQHRIALRNCGVIDPENIDEYIGADGYSALGRILTERIPPRMAVRRGAALETPHVMMLADDPGCTLIEPIGARKSELKKLYEGELMQGGGHIAGWAVEDPAMLAQIDAALAALGSQEAFDAKYPQARGAKPLTLAVGDGNHSLAAAKACWEELKATLTPEERESHPARWCLVELVNVHSPALGIEPIHRAVFGVSMTELAGAFLSFAARHGAHACGMAGAQQTFCFVDETCAGPGTAERVECLKNAPWPLAVGTLDAFLTEFLAQRPGAKVDYIHGADNVRALARAGAVGVILPDFAKSDLFRGVVLGGVLPKKTFSMGHAEEKRYYLECRQIAPQTL